MSFWNALEAAVGDIGKAILGLLPFFLAYKLYGIILQTKSHDLTATWQGRIIIAYHAAVALGIVAVIVYFIGSNCSTDEFGNCSDLDWAPSTSEDNLKNMIRLAILVLGGMAAALFGRDRHLS